MSTKAQFEMDEQLSVLFLITFVVVLIILMPVILIFKQ
jgi:hypothetical protein